MSTTFGGFIPRFLFQTTLGSGAAAGFPPLAFEYRGTEPLPLPVFATRRGRADKVAEPGGGVELETGLSVGLVEMEPALALDAKKFLLTESALNVAGFLTEEAVRPCDLSSSLAFDPSGREASVSDPPLTLTSAEFSWSSTLVMCLFSMSSWPEVPFTTGWSRPTWLTSLGCCKNIKTDYVSNEDSDSL